MRYLLILCAGLCLALMTSCGNSGPMAPAPVLDHLNCQYSDGTITITAIDQYGDILPDNSTIEAWWGLYPGMENINSGQIKLASGYSKYNVNSLGLMPGSIYYFKFCLGDICAKISVAL